jgi:predicted HTH domain antitoxin
MIIHVHPNDDSVKSTELWPVLIYQSIREISINFCDAIEGEPDAVLAREEILSSLNQDKNEFIENFRLYIALKLFKEHKLSSWQAAALAGLGKCQFWMELGRHNIPLINYDPSELEDELKKC